VPIDNATPDELAALKNQLASKYADMDKKLAAEKIRARLEERLANFLGCEVGDLPRLKLGELVHLAFAIWGEEETLGGFHTTITAVGQLVGQELLWDIEPKAEETETPKVVN
jgi:hypothetical protein